MRYVLISMVALGASVLTGCVPPSKHPLYTQEDVVFDEALLGDWQAVNGVPLLKLGDHYFINFDGGEDDHTFYRVSLSGNQLEVRQLGGSWLLGLVEKDPKAIQHEIKEQEFPFSKKKEPYVRLTASTKELQAFVLAHVYDQGAFGMRPPFSRWERARKVDVAESGIASKSQRTFDHWYQLRQNLLGLGVLSKDAKRNEVDQQLGLICKDLEGLSTVGVDDDAAECSSIALKTYRKLARLVMVGPEQTKLPEAFVRGLIEDPFRAAKGLPKDQKELAG